MSKKVRLTIVKIGAGAKQAPLLVSANISFTDLLKQCDAKLKGKSKRIFVSSGEEVTASNLSSVLVDGVKLMVSKGENYETHITKPKVETKARVPKEDADEPDDNDNNETEESTTTAAATTPSSSGSGSGSGMIVRGSDGIIPESLQREIASATPIVGGAPPLIRVLAVKSWLEDDARKQLNQTATALPGVRMAVGMPDLHPGQGFPVGTAFAAEENIFPFLIGGDIGCGMSLVMTPLKQDKATPKQLERWTKKLYGLDDAWRGDIDNWLTKSMEWPAGQKVTPVTQSCFDKKDESLEGGIIHVENYHSSVGTIGGGNHFAELQQIETIVDEKRFTELKLSADQLYLLVHSGSRGLGAAILAHHSKLHGTKGLRGSSPAGQHYLSMHDAACAWAKRNRALIADRFLSCLNAGMSSGSRCVMDIWHNNVVNKSFSQPCYHHDALKAFYPLAPTKAAATTTVTAFTPHRQLHDNDADVGDNDAPNDKPEDFDSVVAPAKSSSPSPAATTAAASPATVVPSSPATPPAPAAAATSTPAPAASSSSTESKATPKIEAKETAMWLHRKGAAPGDMGPLVIPGSRGAFSYLVQPIGSREEQEYAGYSLAHGAGRKWHRGRALKNMKARYVNPIKLLVTELDSHVICEDKDLLYEEAPQAYKDIEQVMQDMIDHGLIEVIAILRPLITYKMRLRADAPSEGDHM